MSIPSQQGALFQDILTPNPETPPSGTDVAAGRMESPGSYAGNESFLPGRDIYHHNPEAKFVT